MMKKALSILILVILVIGISVPVFADDAGIPDNYLSAEKTGFTYKHLPLENSRISKDIVFDPGAIYGYSPVPLSERFAAYIGVDWTDAVKVNEAKRERVAEYKAGSVTIDPAVDACLGLYDHYFTAYVVTGNADAYSPEDEAFVSGWGKNRPDDILWAQYEDVYRNPVYYDSSTGDIIWPENEGFYGESFDYTLMPYTRIDRYGSDYGTYVSLVGHPYEDYSLAPGSEYKNYSVFIVRKPIEGRAGAIYPWFDSPGLATQVILPMPVKNLLANGSLERVVYR